MHRIDVPSATADNKFTDGSPSGGIPATTVPAVWLNDLQENIMAVLAGGGVAGTKGDAQDLLDAINAIVDGSLAPFTPVEQGGGIGQSTNKIHLGYAESLSRPSVTVDSTNYGGVAFMSDLVAMPITKEFQSTQQAFTSGGLVSVSHGLGVLPKIVMGELVCLVAENGFQVGDVQFISLSPDNDDSSTITGFVVRKDATAIYARCGANGPYGVNINTGATAISTPANWRLVLRAFA